MSSRLFDVIFSFLIHAILLCCYFSGKRYTLLDVTACLCMSIGLIFFTLADSKMSPNFSAYGVFLINMALVADAIIGNVQEKTMKQYSASNSEMVCCESRGILTPPFDFAVMDVT